MRPHRYKMPPALGNDEIKPGSKIMPKSVLKGGPKPKGVTRCCLPLSLSLSGEAGHSGMFMSEPGQARKEKGCRFIRVTIRFSEETPKDCLRGDR